MKVFIGYTLMMLLMASPFLALAQESHEGLDTEAIKQANNPMASIKTLNVHNYYISSIHGMPDGVTGNQFMLRYAQPVGRFIIRATMPFVTTSVPSMPNGSGFSSSSVKSGLGDFNMFVIYDLYKKGGTQVGIGPLVTLPTGTNDQGSEKWQAGLSALVFVSNSAQIQMGGLLQWAASFAGSDDKPDINMLTAQAFFLWQLGKGTYLRSTGVWSFDLENEAGNIPVGLGIGKVIKAGKTVFNIFVEPQYSVFTYGDGQSKFQTFIGFNTQF